MTDRTAEMESLIPGYRGGWQGEDQSWDLTPSSDTGTEAHSLLPSLNNADLHTAVSGSSLGESSFSFAGLPDQSERA